MYSLAVGAVGREATIQVTKESGTLPEDFEAETAETAEEAEVPEEEAGTTEETDTSSATE